MSDDNTQEQVVTVPISSLRRGDSPRLAGEDEDHIARLAETETPLPPILVDRRNMRVVDGMHRLLAALLSGQDTIEVEFFDGDAHEAFLRAVRENVSHGYPLSRADRTAAAARIMESHPAMSDRAIAESVGLGATTVGRIRRRSTEPMTQSDKRVGQDGRTRPLSGAKGRLRAAELLAARPQMTLREVAREAEISPSTACDVRKRLERGEEPTSRARPARRQRDAAPRPDPILQPAEARVVRVVQSAPASVLEKLLRDPSLRHNEQGRTLLRLLQYNAQAQHQLSITDAVPLHCAALVAQLAQQYARMWADVAHELCKRMQVSGMEGGLPAGRHSVLPSVSG